MRNGRFRALLVAFAGFGSVLAFAFVAPQPPFAAEAGQGRPLAMSDAEFVEAYESPAAREQLAAADAEQAAADAQWIEELDSSEAQAEREDSQAAFANLDGADARETLEVQHAEALDLLDLDPVRAISDERIERVEGDSTALIDPGSPGGPEELVDSSLPLLAMGEGGEEQPVDLDRIAVSGGFEPRNPLVPVTLPAQSGSGVTIADAVAIELQGADPSRPGLPLGDKDVIYPNISADTDLIVSPIALGVEMFAQLRSPDSPEELRFEYTLPADTQLVSAEDGAVAMRGTEVVARIPSVWAMDAQGSPVEATMSVEGSDLVVTVPHRDLNVAYPVLVDPVTDVYDWYSNNDEEGFAEEEWFEKYSSESLEQQNKFVLATECRSNLAPCAVTSNSGRGAYVYGKSTNYGPDDSASWHYRPPGEDTFVKSVDLTHQWYRKGTDSDGRPNLFSALLTPSGYTSIKTWTGSASFSNQATHLSHGDNQPTFGFDGAQAVVFGLNVSNEPTTLNDIRWGYLGGAAITLDDSSKPDLVSADVAVVEQTAVGAFGWTGPTLIRATASATDAGLGVRHLRMTRPLDPGGAEILERSAACSGGFDNPCPASFDNGDRPFSFSTTDTGQGQRTLLFRAIDALDKSSVAVSEEIKVDTKPPVIDLEGGLATEAPAYAPDSNLRVSATDGNFAGGPESWASGVKEIRITVDSEQTQVFSNPNQCDRPEGSRPQSKNFTLDRDKYLRDNFTIRISAFDCLGQHTSKTLNVRFQPDGTPPSITGENVLQSGAVFGVGNWTREATYRVSGVSATDDNKGMKLFRTRVPQASGPAAVQERIHDCTGDAPNACPKAWSLPSSTPPRSEFEQYSTNAMPQGVSEVDLEAEDIVGNRASKSFSVRVDREGPELELTGGLSQEVPAVAPNQILHFEATDGNPIGPPSAYRSGVRRVSVQVDEMTPQVFTFQCEQAKGSCKGGGDFRLDLFETPKNVFEIEVVATDYVGNVTSRTLNVRLDGGPPVVERVLTCENAGGSCIDGTSDGNGNGVPDGDAPRWVSSNEIESTIFSRDPFPADLGDSARNDRGIDAVRLFMPDGTKLTKELDCGTNPDSEPCPAYAARSFNFSAAELDQGRQTISARARNASGDASPARSFSVRVDRAPPQINTQLFESSPLYQQRNQLAYPLDYALRIQAYEGTTANPQAGVERIEVFVDTRRVFLDAKRCAEGQNCSLDRTFTFATPEYGSGRHYVEAVVTDGAGNTTRRGFNVENPAGLGESQLPAQKFGLENYFHYDSTETGLSGAHVNLGTGNAVFHRVPMMNPGRGISSVLNLSYNSYDYPLGGNLPDPGDSRFVSGEYDEVGLGWSLALSGLTRINEPLGGVAVSGTPNGAAPPARITLTDPDGTLHTFTAKTDNGELFAYKPPPGVNLRLRAFADQLKQIKLPEQHTKAYAITRPDGITYFFDGWGFLRSIEDRNHNVMSFEYETTLLDGGVACGVVVPGVCEPRLKRVVDAAGNDPGASAQLKTRRSFTFDYYPLIGSPHSGASGRISTITDHAGRQMTFTYNSSGFLTNTAEAPGTSEARRFTFTYDQPDLLKDPTAHPQLRTITDPRGNSSQILYEDKARLPLTGRAVRAIYNRRGNFRSFGYNKPEQENTASNAYVTDARGKPWAFALDGRDRLVSQHDPLGRITGLEWDSDNNVISHTEAMNTADQATTLFTYNQNGALTSQTDPLGRITALTYRDSAGVHRSEHNSNQLDADVDAFVSDLTGIRRPNGTSWTYELEHQNATNGAWTPNGNVLAQTDPTGAVARADYYNKGVPGEHRDFGMVKSETNEAGSKTEYVSYDPSGMPTEIIAPRGTNAEPQDGTRAEHRWLYRYDDAGNLRQSVDPRGAVGLPSGPLSQAIDSSSKYTTTLGYTAHHQLSAERVPKDTNYDNPAARKYITRGYVYDLNGNLDKRTDGEGELWDTDYSRMDRPEQELTPEGEKTTYGYDAEESLIQITAPRQFDPNEPIASARAFITEFKLDAVGRRLVTRLQGPTASSDLVTSYSYDRRDNVVGLALPKNNTSGEAAVSDAVAIANAQGESTQRFRYTFDKADQLVAEVENPTGSCVDRQNPRIQHQYRYDLNGNRTSELGPRGFCDLAGTSGQTTIYDYTPRDEIAAVTNPAGDRSEYRYTPDGLIAAEISPRAGETSGSTDFATSYQYDANRDLESKTLPFRSGDYGLSAEELSARKLTYVRDAVGNPIEVTDPVGNLARHRVTQDSFVAHNQELAALHTFKNEFFDTGDVKSTTRPGYWRWKGPGSRLMLAESSSNVGQEGGELPSSGTQGDLGTVAPQSMPGYLPKAGKTDFSYDNEMRLTGITDHEGMITTLAYDTIGRLTSQAHPFDPGGVPELPASIVEDFRYDAAGNLTESEDGEDALTKTDYDAFDRPIREQLPESGAGPEVVDLTYDPNGNVTRRITPEGDPWDFEYDNADRLLSEANPLEETTRYSYNASGGRTLSLSPLNRVVSTGYDPANRPVSITEGTGSIQRTTHFTLDAAGNRIEIDAPGAAPSSGAQQERRVTSQTFDGRDLPWVKTTQADFADEYDATDGQASDDERVAVTEFDPNGNLRREIKPAGVGGGTSVPPDPGVRFTRESSGLPDISNDPVVRNATRDATLYEYSPDDIKNAIHHPWSTGGASSGEHQNATRYRQDFELNARGWVKATSHPYKWAEGEDPVSTRYTHYETGWIATADDPTFGPPEEEGGAGGSSQNRPRDRFDGHQSFTYRYDTRGNQTLWKASALQNSQAGVEEAGSRQIVRKYFDSGALEVRKGFGTNTGVAIRTHTYSYDKNRNLRFITDALKPSEPNVTEATEVRYDDADRVKVVEEMGAGSEPDTCYSYTADGDLENVHTDGQFHGAGIQCAQGYTGGKKTTYGYDDLGQEVSMDVEMPDSGRDRDVDTSYWPSGDVRTRTKANGTTESFYFDRDGMAALKVREPDSGADETQNYEYDRNGNRVKDERGTYAYNSRDHLVSWTRPEGDVDEGGFYRGGTVTYIPDGSGAVTHESDPELGDGFSSETEYEYFGQRLKSSVTTVSGPAPTETTDRSYAYDDYGNLIRIYEPDKYAKPDAEYEFDVFNRQELAKTKISDEDTGGYKTKTEEYTYDGLDRRETKTVDGSEEHAYAYIGLTEQLATETETGGEDDGTKNYDYSSTGLRLGQESEAQDSEEMAFRPYDHDAQGTVVGLESESGELEGDDRYQLDPYGELENEPPDPDPTDPNAPPPTSEDALSDEAEDNPFRFQGHYYDSGVQSYDMRARQYLPELNRFASEDRFEAAGADLVLQSDPLTQNRYAFAGGNPVSRVEWDGHWSTYPTYGGKSKPSKKSTDGGGSTPQPPASGTSGAPSRQQAQASIARRYWSVAARPPSPLEIDFLETQQERELGELEREWLELEALDYRVKAARASASVEALTPEGPGFLDIVKSFANPVDIGLTVGAAGLSLFPGGQAAGAARATQIANKVRGLVKATSATRALSRATSALGTARSGLSAINRRLYALRSGSTVARSGAQGVNQGFAVGAGFNSFSQFKRILGPAGANRQWHHLVEQTPGNVARFGPGAVHNTGNLVRLETGIHRKVSGFYSSKQPFTSGQTVRQWLSNQSYAQQQQFSNQTIQRFGGLP